MKSYFIFLYFRNQRKKGRDDTVHKSPDPPSFGSDTNIEHGPGTNTFCLITNWLLVIPLQLLNKIYFLKKDKN